MSHLHHRVSALIDGELSPSARSRALAHARSCLECRRDIAETLEVKRRLHRLAPVDVSEDLLDLVTSRTPTYPPSPDAERAPLVRRILVGAGSLSAVVIALAYVAGAPVPTQVRTVHPSVEEFAAQFAEGTGSAPLSDPAVGGIASTAEHGTVGPMSYAPNARPWKRPSPGTAPSQFAPVTLRSGDEPLAVRLLRKAALAPQRVAFTGRRVVASLTAGGFESSTVDVQHDPGQGTTFDVVDGSGASLSTWFTAQDSGNGGGLEGGPVAPLSDAYDLHVGGSETVDGRQATIVSASDGGQVRARFWVDDDTGLLLRRELYVDGGLVRWSGYTSISTPTDGFMRHLPPQVQTAPDTTLSMSVASALGDKGWTCPTWLTADFRLSTLHDVETDGGVMRAEYTDGLSTVSVFEERGALDATALRDFHATTVGTGAVYVHDGLPEIAIWESDGTVFTLVTDAPQQMVRPLILRLPHNVDDESDGVFARIGSGLTRMASAVSP